MVVVVALMVLVLASSKTNILLRVVELVISASSVCLTQCFMIFRSGAEETDMWERRVLYGEHHIFQHSPILLHPLSTLGHSVSAVTHQVCLITVLIYWVLFGHFCCHKLFPYLCILISSHIKGFLGCANHVYTRSYKRT